MIYVRALLTQCKWFWTVPHGYPMVLEVAFSGIRALLRVRYMQSTSHSEIGLFNSKPNFDHNGNKLQGLHYYMRYIPGLGGQRRERRVCKTASWTTY